MNKNQEHGYLSSENLATRENFRIYYTPQTLAEMWQCSIETVYDLLRKGKLNGFKLGRDWRIAERAVLEYERAPENQCALHYKQRNLPPQPQPKKIMRVV